jgi:hypothetical protein
MSDKQKKMDKILARQQGALETGLTDTINWIKEYASAANGGVNNQSQQVVDTFSKAGYAAGEHSGENLIQDSKYSMGRYIVGQVMACLIKRQCLPNAAQFMPDRYNEMPGEPVEPAAPSNTIAVMRPIKLKIAP